MYLTTKKTLQAILLICLGIALALPSMYGLASSLILIHNQGYLGVVAVFSDSTLTQPVSTLNWTTVFPGATANQTVYIKNFGGQNVRLSMTVSNWLPLNASQYMSVTWNYENATLPPGVAEPVPIYLTVPANATLSGISGFSFDISINPAW